MRLFTGIALPSAQHDKLKLVQSGIPDARWTVPSNFHVTLTFIGEIPENRGADIDEALMSVEAHGFPLGLKSMGCFTEGDRPQHLWAGVEAPEELHMLKHKIDRVLQQNQIQLETRKYTPHATIARLRNPDPAVVAEYLSTHAAFNGGAFEVNEFVLYESIETKDGFFYEEIAAYPLLPLMED